MTQIPAKPDTNFPFRFSVWQERKCCWESGDSARELKKKEEETCLDLSEKIIASHFWHAVICNDHINFNLLHQTMKKQILPQKFYKSNVLNKDPSLIFQICFIKTLRL